MSAKIPKPRLKMSAKATGTVPIETNPNNELSATKKTVSYNLSDIVSRQMANPSELGAKRKADVISISSSSEDNSPTSSLKKLKKTAAPRPGTPEYNALPAVTITCGKPSPSTAKPQPQPIATQRPKREITMSQKAKAAAASTKGKVTRIPPTPNVEKTHKASKGKGRLKDAAISDSDELPSPSEIAQSFSSSRLVPSARRNPSDEEPGSPDSFVATEPTSSQPPIIAATDFPSSQNIVAEEALEDPFLYDQKLTQLAGVVQDFEDEMKEPDVYEAKEAVGRNTVIEKEPTDHGESEDDGQGDIQGEIPNDVEDLELDDDEPAVLGVTDPIFQDSVLAANGVYLNLPHIKVLVNVRPFYPLRNKMFEMVPTFSNLQEEGLSQSEMESILQMLLFKQAGRFVNTARIDPAVLKYGSPVILAGTDDTLAIGIMGILVRESHIITGTRMGNETGSLVRRLTGLPFAQEWRRDISVWAHKLQFTRQDAIPAYVSEEGITFQTRTERGGHRYAQISSPQATSSKKRLAHVPGLVSPSKPTPNTFEYSSRSFEDGVPIYDGRATTKRRAFSFTKTDFDKLAQWPLLKGEIPKDSVVAVGYLFNKFGEGGKEGLSSNIFFAIVLAIGKD